MNNKNANKYSREIVTSILGIMILILLLFSTSYAIFIESANGNKINSLTTGYLSLNYTNNDSNVINLVDALPVSDQIGKFDNNKVKEYEFTISNNFTKEIKYNILIEELVSEIDSKYLKIYLTDEYGNLLYDYNNIPVLESFENDELGRKIIYSNKLSTSNKTYKLRIWVSDEYTKNEPVTFSFKLSVSGKV